MFFTDDLTMEGDSLTYIYRYEVEPNAIFFKTISINDDKNYKESRRSKFIKQENLTY